MVGDPELATSIRDATKIVESSLHGMQSTIGNLQAERDALEAELARQRQLAQINYVCLVTRAPVLLISLNR